MTMIETLIKMMMKTMMHSVYVVYVYYCIRFEVSYFCVDELTKFLLSFYC